MIIENLQLCIFDLDGVVVDTAKYHYIAWKTLAEEFGYHLTVKKNELLKGVSRVNSLDLILSWADVELTQSKKDELLIEKNIEYLELIKGLKPSDAFDGFVDFVSDLKNHDIKISLGSASKNAIPILEKLEIFDMFDFIVDGTMTKNGKPHPEVFLTSSKHFKINPENCIVFEDAPKGIESAHNGNMYAIGIGDKKDLAVANTVWSGFEGRSYKDILSLPV